MNSSSGENLPPPRFELPPQAAEVGVERARDAVDRAETGAESTVGKQQQPQLPAPVPVTVTPPTTTPVPPPATTPGHATAATTSLTADDVDLIEKPWVAQTKKVIAATREDPYKQKNEVSRVKVDYVKKRFNKVIPLDEAAT